MLIKQTIFKNIYKATLHKEGDLYFGYIDKKQNVMGIEIFLNDTLVVYAKENVNDFNKLLNTITRDEYETNKMVRDLKKVLV